MRSPRGLLAAQMKLSHQKFHKKLRYFTPDQRRSNQAVNLDSEASVVERGLGMNLS